MKKCLCAVLALFMALSLAGCGGDKNSTVQLTEKERAEYTRADYLDLSGQADSKKALGRDFETKKVFVEGVVKDATPLSGQNFTGEFYIDQPENYGRTSTFRIEQSGATGRGLTVENGNTVRVYGFPELDKNDQLMIVVNGVEKISKDDLTKLEHPNPKTQEEIEAENEQLKKEAVEANWQLLSGDNAPLGANVKFMGMVYDIYTEDGVEMLTIVVIDENGEYTFSDQKISPYTVWNATGSTFEKADLVQVYGMFSGLSGEYPTILGKIIEKVQ